MVKTWAEIADVVISTMGIYACFICHGVCQESIYRMTLNTSGPWGTTQDSKFKYPIFLVSLVCSLSAALGYLITRFEREPSKIVPSLKEIFGFRPFEPLPSNSTTNKARPPSEVEMMSANARQERFELLRQGFYVSLSYMGAMIATNFALTRVYYPMQIIVKSGKAIPVIVGGYFFFGKTYHYSDYLTVFCVIVALLLFQMGNLMNPKYDTASTWAGFGALLLSLFFDGLTGPRQDKMVETYGIRVGDLMLVINLCAMPLGWTASVILEGLSPFIVLLNNYSALLPRIMLFLVCGSVGQAFIVRVLRSIGALHLTLITTSRKFLAILISVAIYGHKLTKTQWFSIVLLFSSGFFKYVLREKPASSPPPSAPSTAFGKDVRGGIVEMPATTRSKEYAA